MNVMTPNTNPLTNDDQTLQTALGNAPAEYDGDHPQKFLLMSRASDPTQ